MLRRRLGRMTEHRVGRTLALTALASAAMGLLAYGVLRVVSNALPVGGLAELLAVVGPGLAGATLYVGLLSLFRIEEMRLLWGALRRKLSG